MNKFLTALKTNENNARTKTLIAAAITATTIAAGVYLTKKAVPATLILEVTEVVTDAATDIASE